MPELDPPNWRAGTGRKLRDRAIGLRINDDQFSKYQLSDGASMSVSREHAIRRSCPTCLSPPGVRCCNNKGEERRSVHRARMRGKRSSLAEIFPEADPFYVSDDWRRLRYRALRRSNGACCLCGARAAPERPLHVDHIKPRSRFPELELDPSNLQVMCTYCNLGKGASDSIDWRR
jgi:5-methylcytosine-specific restriction endonuclease McrA